MKSTSSLTFNQAITDATNHASPLSQRCHHLAHLAPVGGNITIGNTADES